MTHINVENLSVYYNGQPGLRNIEVNIPRNKLTAIIGPSGCGKSTLLKTFNRLTDEPEGIKIKGTVRVDGEDIFDKKVDVTQVRKRVGLLAQRPQVLPMSIYDNVAYGPRIHGLRNRRELNKIVEDHLQMAGLWEEVKDRLSSPASGLSIGQQQRLCLARGLAVEPEIILADESTSALDPISAETIERRFMELKKDYTIVMVTHVLRQARRLADYVIFLYMGRLIEHGPAEEFFNRPKFAKTQAYLSGRFIEEHKIDREVDLKWTTMDDQFAVVCDEFGKIKFGQILRVTVDREDAVDQLSHGIENEGHQILEAKRVGKQSWEVVAERKK